MVMRIAAFAIAAVFCAALLAAQEAPQPQTFEVVSIKPTPDPPIRTGTFPIPGTLTVGNYTLSRLISQVYRLQGYQLTGGPAWAYSDHFDIVAKAPFKATFMQMLEMLKPMMADRFELKTHPETRELPMYALTVLKSGPKLKPYDAAEAKGKSFGIRPGDHGTKIESWDLTMKAFAQILAGQVQSPVTDETGLEGSFRFTLEYSPEDLRQREPGEAPSDPGPASIYQAIQEQLGLRLDKRKGPVDVMVIDHAEKPPAN